MIKKALLTAVALLVIFIFCNFSLAGGSCDTEKVREMTDQLLSTVPESGYHISADDMMKRMNSGKNDFVIVDVRETPTKYKAGHAPGANYISFRDLAKPESLAKLPKDKDVLL
jgi:hypothetical protein